MKKNRDEREIKIGEDCKVLDTKTQLAYERTFLANERTLIAWLRTAVALVGAGLGVVKFLDMDGPYYLMKTLGILLVVAGELGYIGAYIKYRKLSLSLCHLQQTSPPKWILLPLNVTVLLMSIISLLVIFNN